MTGFLRLYRCGAAVLGCVLLTALPAAAQFDRGQISGTVKDAQGGVVPGATVTITNNQHADRPARPSPTASGFFTVPEPGAGTLRRLRRAPGLQEVAAARTSSSTPPARVTLDFTLETGALTRGTSP